MSLPKNIIYLAFSIFILFVAVNAALADDPNLIGWWTFDEGTGTTAADSSGNGYNASLLKGAYAATMTGFWTPGKLGGAYNFNGTTYGNIAPASMTTVANAVTIAFWAYGNAADMPKYGHAFQAYGPHEATDPAKKYSNLDATFVTDGGGGVWGTQFIASAYSTDQLFYILQSNQYENQWHHFAYTKDVATGQMRIYVDGSLVYQETGKTLPIPHYTDGGVATSIYSVAIGAGIYGSSPMYGALDDFKIYNRALTTEEIYELANTIYSDIAYYPVPEDEAVDVPQNSSLQWSPGTDAVSHDIYFGTDPNAVNNAVKLAGDVDGSGEVDLADVVKLAVQWLSDGSVGLSADLNDDEIVNYLDFAVVAANYGQTGEGIYRGHQKRNVRSYAPDNLTLGTTYYWRIDEVNGATVWKGNVWSFTTSSTPMLAGAEIETQYLRYTISSSGDNVGFIDKQSDINYGVSSKFARLVKGGSEHAASSVSFLPLSNQILAQFGSSGITALIDVVQQDDYFTFQINSLSDPNVDSFSFVNIPLTNEGSLDDVFPGCVLALNLQTNVTAMPGSMSSLSAVSYQRFGVIGGKAAVIGCPKSHLRQAMKSAVTDANNIDGLPKSTSGGPWAMDDPNNYGSYLFSSAGMTPITASSASSWIGVCNTVGIYQIDFNQSFRYGDYRPDPSTYPNGFTDVKAATDALRAAGIKSGLHTMAYYIDKSCSWVTPIPDPRLDSWVDIPLTSAVTSTATTIPITATASVVTILQNGLSAGTKTIRIENELLTFGGVSGTAPSYSLTGCVRGVLGTTKAAHNAGQRAYHLKEEMGLFVPNGDSTLLAEVAAKMADTFNQGGFDMLYLDGLNGEGIFAGWDVSWYYGSKFTFEVAKRLNKPALMEMSIFHHHLWYLRSRMGAWDVSSRGHKSYIDRHVLGNEYGESMLASFPCPNMFMPQHLGWFIPVSWNPPQDEVTFPDIFEYLCGKCIGYDAGLSMMGFYPGGITTFTGRLAAIVKNYESLRLSNYFSQSVKDQLKVLGDEFTLRQNPGTSAWEFYPVQYSRHRSDKIDGSANVWTVNNDFDAQPLKVRIEALRGTGVYNAGGTSILASFADPATEFSVTSALGVTASLISSTEQVQIAPVSGKLTVTNNSAEKTAAWARAAKVYTTAKNLSAYQGMGVWIYGDGKGELVNIQVRDGNAFGSPIADHYVDIDFTGWKYIEIVESEGDRYWDYTWPYGWEYTMQFLWVNYSAIKYFDIYVNNINPGDTITCYLSPVRSVQLLNSTLNNPQITIGGSTVIFPCSMPSGYYLEFYSTSDCKLYNSAGNLVSNVVPTGVVPTLQAGSNQITFSCSFSGGQNPRARVTVIGEDSSPIQ